MSNPTSPRRLLLKAIKKAISETGGGKYKYHRGAVNWLKWDFNKYPIGVSITIPEDDDSGQTTEATVNLVFMSRMPAPLDEQAEDLLEDFRDNGRAIFESLHQVKMPGSEDSLVLSVDRLPTVELADADKELLGMSVPAVLGY